MLFRVAAFQDCHVHLDSIHASEVKRHHKSLIIEGFNIFVVSLLIWGEVERGRLHGHEQYIYMYIYIYCILYDIYNIHYIIHTTK